MREVMSVRHALLALLSEGPRYSRQLREEFEAWTGEEWSLNVGQVDTALQRLEREGLAESDAAGADGPQSRFRITADGERELAGWLRTPPDLAFPPHDELATKIRVALRDRKSTRLNSSHVEISYAVFCLKKKELYRVAEGGIHPPDEMPFLVPWTDDVNEDAFLAFHRGAREAWSPERWSCNFITFLDGQAIGSQGVDAKDFAEERTGVDGSLLGEVLRVDSL